MSVTFNDSLTDESSADDCCVRSNESRPVRRALLTQDTVDLAAIKGAVRTILRAVGEDPDRDGLLDPASCGEDVRGDVFWTAAGSGTPFGSYI